jgi:hypothetical protein
VFVDDDAKRDLTSTAGAPVGSSRTLDQGFVAPDGEDEPSHEKRQEQSEVLSLVRVILEREMARVGSGSNSHTALERLLDLVRGHKLDELRDEYRYLISQVEAPTEELERARDIIAKMVGDT